MAGLVEVPLQHQLTFGVLAEHVRGMCISNAPNCFASVLRITQYTRFLGTSRADEIDTLVEEDLRSHLSVSAGLPPTAVSIDLAALIIQRGRDHGLPDYNTMRSAFGFDKLKWVTACVQVMVAMVGINAPPFHTVTRSIDALCTLFVGLCASQGLCKPHVQSGPAGRSSAGVWGH